MEIVRLVMDFFRSGLFFMIVGCGILFIAYEAFNASHSTFTFILVVVGTAILLFGTGTQAIGKADGAAEQIGNYELKMAGGAGLLSLIIAAGLVQYNEEIFETFAPRVSFVRVPVVIEEQATNPDTPSYIIHVTKPNGEHLPTVSQGKSTFVLFDRRALVSGISEPIAVRIEVAEDLLKAHAQEKCFVIKGKMPSELLFDGKVKTGTGLNLPITESTIPISVRDQQCAIESAREEIGFDTL